MTSTMQEMDAMRLAVGEVEALAAMLLAFFDASDWSGADAQLVDRTGHVLGVLATSATSAAGKFERFQIAFVDAQPARSGERWDYDKGTSPGEDDEPDQSSPGNGDEPAMSPEEAEIVRRIRELCPDRRFDGGSDAELLDLFKRNKRVLERGDEDVIAVMTRPR